ncbi:hypothetical protein phytr_6720 [Candidatus Phycorickettsia trachydisci]|uniref:Uncharacterized protein n=1 Tax=Candidatus Phycorickettsia trachydisci TaxID=2115978 RepID=A0A2P1P8L9_9RICK|nr:ankyrin repeat domain-containing protein [Candidatus Phycorickettsia trachydisci]AVP87613.1 hypothetical protein phytr_6720 [Candidatus Phycorickettsia trachydisci]
MGKKSKKKAKDLNKHSSVHTEASKEKVIDPKEMRIDEFETALWGIYKGDPNFYNIINLEHIVPSSTKHFDISEEHLFGNIDILDLGKAPATEGDINKADDIEGALENMKISDLDEILEIGRQDILFLQAVERGDLNTVKSLLQEGTNLSTTNDKGENLFHIAARQGYTNIVEHFSCGINKPKSPQARNEDIDMLRFLVSAQDKDGNKPAQTAAKHNNHEIVSLLLSLPGPYDMVLNDYLISNYSEVLKIGSTIQQILAGYKMLQLLTESAADSPAAFEAVQGLSKKLVPIINSFKPFTFLSDIGIGLKIIPKSSCMLSAMIQLFFWNMHEMPSEIQESTLHMVEKSGKAFQAIKMSETLIPKIGLNMRKMGLNIEENIIPNLNLFKQKLEEVTEILQSHNLEHITRDKETANKVLWGLNALEQRTMLVFLPAESLNPYGQYMKEVYNSLFKEYVHTFGLREEASNKINFDPEAIRSQIYESCSDTTALIGKQQTDEYDSLDFLFA